MRKIKEAGESQVCLCGQMQREREKACKDKDRESKEWKKNSNFSLF